MKIQNTSNSTKRPTQNVRDTSKIALKKMTKSGKLKVEWKETLIALKRIKPATRAMIALEADFPINKITQYVTILINKGLAIEHPQKRKCPTSDRLAYFLNTDIDLVLKEVEELKELEAIKEVKTDQVSDKEPQQTPGKQSALFGNNFSNSI